MIPNLKVDIIYYKTASDFEMEFNLSGYCRMRIFKSTAKTEEELLSALETDLDRSRIIIVVTDVLGKECGVTTIADAVGLEYAAPDKAACGIRTADEIYIPNGAVPLISGSGAYGGCIAESGIQSIIMITDNRALRHDIMKSLVHQYIFDVAQVEAFKERQKFTPNNTITSEESVEKSLEPKANETLPEQNETEAESNSQHSEINNSIFSAPGTNMRINKPEEPKSESQEEFFEEAKTPKRKKQGSDVALLIIVIFLLLAFGVLSYFFVYLPLTGGEMPFSADDGGLGKAIETWLSN